MLKQTDKASMPLASSNVYQAINAVAAALGKSGISKDRQGTGQFNYKFRGIDDVYAALSPLLSEHGLCILPNVLERTCETHTSKSGTNLFYVAVKVRFDIVSVADGSSHSIMTMGEAMDSGDKATNKAMSAAYKYAAFMTFCIPTEGDNDTENTSHEVVVRQQPIAPQPLTLSERVSAFTAHIDKMRSKLAVDNLVAANNKLLSEAKEHAPEQFDKLVNKIAQIQEAFLLAEAAE